MSVPGSLLLRRILSDQKTVPSPLLNRLGLQVFRTITAHGLYRLRRPAIPHPYSGHIAALRRDGIVMIENFLPPGSTPVESTGKPPSIVRHFPIAS